LKYKKIIYGKFTSIKKSKKKKELLDKKTANEYSQLLLNHIDENTPYLDSNLSLRSLASQIDLHPNILSWLINENFGKNFNEFINHYRVDAFKKNAIDPKKEHITLMGLAYESGFNSKTVFNSFFKKEMGMTPGEFLKQRS